MTARREGPTAAPVIERLVKALVVVNKAVGLYPPSSSIPRDTAQEAAAVLGQALEERSEVRIVVTKNGLLHDGAPIRAGEAAYTAFALELYNRLISDVRFHAGATAKDIVAFLSLLKYSPEEIEAAGGFESRLWDSGVGTITVTETKMSIRESAITEDEARDLGEKGFSRSEIDEILAGAYGGRARDQLSVVRFLGDKMAVAEYLTETYVGDGANPDIIAAGERFAELAEIAYESAEGADRAAVMQALGHAFDALDPELKKSLLTDQVLSEARTNEALASVVRQMDIDSVCSALVAQIETDAASREGLARAIRNLALISMSDRGEVMTAAGAAMRSAGMDEDSVSEVLERSSPSRLMIREQAGRTAQAEQPAEAIFRLIDMAPTVDRATDTTDDPEIEMLRDEARRGVTDGDVIMTLVSLVALDPGDTHFASTMSMLEDSLDVLISRGEIDIAADAADALTTTAENPALSRQQQTRLRKAVRRFAKADDIRAVAHALHIYSADSVENRAARRLLAALGPVAIEPLLEQLADEPDMSARKMLVDLLSETASGHISELGAHVTDPRWYVVRNVVSVLGSTKSSAALPYLERTVRYPEPRVRREVIRALSQIKDRMADDLLVAALSDEDAQNVQLAARYLGSAKVRTAIPFLEQVARGEGRGNRTNGPRVEAIEALGRLGATESLQTLESIAGRRAIIGASRVRELRVAAESAIARISASKGDGS